MSLASNDKQASLKHFRRNSYAIGFGCKTNASIIAGGIDDDFFTPSLLLSFAKTLGDALKCRKSILSFDIGRRLSDKGVWIIPSYKSSGLDKTSVFIPEKLDGKRLLELRLGGETISYNFRENTPLNEKLLAYLLASSCGYNVNHSRPDNDGLCRLFSERLSRPSYSVKIGRETPLFSSDIEPVLTRLLEMLLIFIAA